MDEVMNESIGILDIVFLAFIVHCMFIFSYHFLPSESSFLNGYIRFIVTTSEGNVSDMLFWALFCDWVMERLVLNGDVPHDLARLMDEDVTELFM